ncbi:hypothetical protein MMC07_009494 [Pseudocyphellaria aurata]|nr:hypothetical protein [Pseudocyphellaria aurata]
MSHHGYYIPSTRLNNLLFRRSFHDYFVTHLPSSSLYPDSRSSAGPHHQLPRSASKPHHPSSSHASPAPLLGLNRDTTVVRIPLRSAKHHFGVSVSRGTRPYNEDTYQAGVIEIPAFAKRSPLNLTRAPPSSPLQAYRDEQRKERKQQSKGEGDGEGTSAESASGDPQVFYFGVFDGHGGTECSGFLREKLHEYIENAAQLYGLESSLGKRTNALGGGESSLQSASAKEKGSEITTESTKDGAESCFKTLTPSAKASLNDTKQTPEQVASILQSALMKSWQKTVGGYFRRFRPPFFTDPASPASTPAILTHAFLNADLTFLKAQLRLSISASDSVLADAPINASDSLASPSKRHSPPPFKGGSTCSIALISTPTPTPFWHPSSPSTLLTAHCGDTRILLCRTSDGVAIPLTTNHHPSTPSESSRLRRWATSFVTDSFGEERMGGLANTRSFGDMGSKRLGVSAEPEIRRTEMGAGEYSFMVLFSDGISGTATDQEVVDVVKEARTPEMGARDVVGYATEVSSEGDNATCLVVRLGGWERRSEGGGGGWGTRERREWRKKEAADPRGRMSYG